MSKDEDIQRLFDASCIYESKIYIKVLRIMILIGFSILIVCSFSAYFWCDEAASLRFTEYSYRDIMLKYSANDVYPPLYYFMLKFVLDLFSNISGELFFTVTIARLFSIVPYVLTAVLCWRKLKCLEKDGGRELLLIWIVRNDKSLIKKYLLFGFMSAVAFLPWLSVLLGQIKRVSNGWWVEDSSILSELGNYVRFIFPNALLIVGIIFIVCLLKNRKEEGLFGDLVFFYTIYSYSDWHSIFRINLFRVCNSLYYSRDFLPMDFSYAYVEKT